MQIAGAVVIVVEMLDGSVPMLFSFAANDISSDIEAYLHFANMVLSFTNNIRDQGYKPLYVSNANMTTSEGKQLISMSLADCESLIRESRQNGV